MKKVLLTVVALSILLFAATAQASLITNGDFSDGLNGWDIKGHVKWEDGQARLGIPHISFGGKSSISQEFYIALGTTEVRLSFDLTFSGNAWNLIGSNVADVVFSTLQKESWWGLHKDWNNYEVYTWSSGQEHTTISVDTVLQLDAAFLDKNPNAKLTFLLDESFLGGLNISLNSYMYVGR